MKTAVVCVGHRYLHNLNKFRFFLFPVSFCGLCNKWSSIYLNKPKAHMNRCLTASCSWSSSKNCVQHLYNYITLRTTGARVRENPKRKVCSRAAWNIATWSEPPRHRWRWWKALWRSKLSAIVYGDLEARVNCRGTSSSKLWAHLKSTFSLKAMVNFGEMCCTKFLFIN